MESDYRKCPNRPRIVTRRFTNKTEGATLSCSTERIGKLVVEKQAGGPAAEGYRPVG